MITGAASACTSDCSGSASGNSVSVAVTVNNPGAGDTLSLGLGGFAYQCPDRFSPTGYYPTVTGPVGVDLWQPDGSLDPAQRSEQVTLTFPEQLRPPPWFFPFYQVCYASTEPFSGGTLASAAQSIPGYAGSTYIGLLPLLPLPPHRPLTPPAWSPATGGTAMRSSPSWARPATSGGPPSTTRSLRAALPAPPAGQSRCPPSRPAPGRAVEGVARPEVVMRICPSCGEENPERFRLCGFCGAPLAAQAPPQEVRKTVTVVFSDLKGSTALGERLDSEAVREVLDVYFTRDAARPRAPRRAGGEVRRRRDHGRLRSAPPPRGRRPARGPGRPRDAQPRWRRSTATSRIGGGSGWRTAPG